MHPTRDCLFLSTTTATLPLCKQCIFVLEARAAHFSLLKIELASKQNSEAQEISTCVSNIVTTILIEESK